MGCSCNDAVKSFSEAQNAQAIAALTVLTQRLGTRMDSVEAKLDGFLGGEEGTAREIIDQIVQERMGAAIEAERTEREAADATLQNGIDALTASAATKAELEAERTERLDKDALLSGAVANVDSKVERLVASEQTSREEADAALSQRIDDINETIAALDIEAVVSRVDTKVAEEANAREAADDAISARVDAVVTRLEDLESTIGSLDSVTSRIAALEETSAEQGATIAEHSESLSSLATRMDAAEGTIAEHATSLTSLATRMDSTETAVGLNTEAVAAMQTRLDTFDAQFAALDATTRSYCEAVGQRVKTLENAIRAAIAGNSNYLSSLMAGNCKCGQNG